MGRLGTDRTDLRDMPWLEDCTDRAVLLFVFVEVQVRGGDHLPDAQRRYAKGDGKGGDKRGKSLPRAAKSA